MELYNTSKPLLKKSKLPLSELIQKEYPGRMRFRNCKDLLAVAELE